jgi:SHS2 domain-containing protein
VKTLNYENEIIITMFTYKFIDHTADIAAEVTGSSLEDMFIAAAAALHESVLEDYTPESNIDKQLTFMEDSIEEILVSFLNELNFWTITSKCIFNSVKEIKISKDDKWHLEAVIPAEEFNPSKHILKEEIKAVTYHQMNIVEENGIFRTLVVFDI